MEALTAVADLLAPMRCLSCRRRAQPPWCRHCLRDVVTYDTGCTRCGSAERNLGHPCWPVSTPISGTQVAFDYRGPVARAVVTAKVGGARAAWPPLGVLLATRVLRQPPAVDVVTWVTTPRRRVRRRGLDHAQTLAAVVARELELPLVRLLAADESRGGDDRYRATTVLPGTNVLLVDDVLTTGATASTVAGVLRAAGAGEIRLAVLARAGSSPLTDASAGDPGDVGDVRPRPEPVRP